MAGQSETCDVLVVGGGPAGAAIAIRLSGYGFDVCIAEQAAFGSTPIRGPGEVRCGEVNANPGNTGFVPRDGWNSVGWNGRARFRADSIGRR